MSNTTPTAPVATPDEVKSFRQLQADEWGTYVAVAPISFGGALAYLPGDPVPASNVAKHGYADVGLVAKTSTKAGQEVIKALHTNAVQAAQGPVDLGDPVTLGVPVTDSK